MPVLWRADTLRLEEREEKENTWLGFAPTVLADLGLCCAIICMKEYNVGVSTWLLHILHTRVRIP